MFKFNKSLARALSVLLIGASFKAFAMDPPSDEEDHSAAAAAARPPQAAHVDQRVESFFKGMTPPQWTIVIDLLQSYPSQHRETLFSTAYTLVEGETISGEMKFSIIQKLAQVPADRLRLCTIAGKRLFTKQMNGRDKSFIIHALGQVHPKCIDRVCSIIEATYQTESSFSKCRLIQTIAEGASFKAFAMDSFSDEEDDPSAAAAAARPPRAAWNALETMAERLCPPNYSLDYREDFITVMQGLITEEMKAGMMFVITTNILNVPSERLMTCATAGKRLFTKQMNGWDKSFIIHALGQVHPERIDRVCSIIEATYKTEPSFSKCSLIQTLAEGESDQLEALKAYLLKNPGFASKSPHLCNPIARFFEENPPEIGSSSEESESESDDEDTGTTGSSGKGEED